MFMELCFSISFFLLFLLLLKNESRAEYETVIQKSINFSRFSPQGEGGEEGEQIDRNLILWLQYHRAYQAYNCCCCIRKHQATRTAKVCNIWNSNVTSKTKFVT